MTQSRILQYTEKMLVQDLLLYSEIACKFHTPIIYKMFYIYNFKKNKNWQRFAWLNFIFQIMLVHFP